MSASNEWHDDTFWSDFYNTMFTGERVENAEQEVRGAQMLAGVETKKVLDLGCGPGRHAVALAQRGLEVCGVDLSAMLLAEAAHRAEQAGVDIEWVQGDMREFTRPETFDLIVNLWTSFGYSASTPDDIKVLKHCQANLRPGGAFVIDIASKEYVVRQLEPISVREYATGILIEKPRLTHDMCVLENEWIAIEGIACFGAIGSTACIRVASLENCFIESVLSRYRYTEGLMERASTSMQIVS